MAESGANIVSIHLPGDPLQLELEISIRSVGRECTAFECDVGNSAALRAVFQSIWDAAIVPDILLNCAGLNRRGPIEEMTDDKIDLVRMRL
jgi:2-deoxy-D-gluconate 3-dehydrogenase